MTTKHDTDITQMRGWMARRYDEAADLGPIDSEALRDALTPLLEDVKELLGALKSTSQAAIPDGSVKATFVNDDTGETRTVRKSSPKKKYVWDDELLLDAVVARAADMRRVDTDTGEALERSEEAVVRVVGEVWDLRAQKARVTVVNGLGLKMDDYRYELPQEAS